PMSIEYISSLDIPLKDASEVVTINLETELPDDPTELCNLLENESAPRLFWLAITAAYGRSGKLDEATEVINRALAFSEFSSTEDRAAFYSALSWLYIHRSRSAPKSDLATLQTAAAQAINEAMKLDPHRISTTLARGVWTITNSDDPAELEKASRIFEEVLRRDSRNLLALMGRARVLYSRGAYKAALKIYQNVLSLNPSFSPDPRIGIGLCFWRLNHLDMAVAAWKRADAVSNGTNTTATLLIGVSLMHNALQNPYSTEFASLYSTGLNMVQSVYQQNKQSPAAAVLLSSYLYSKKQTDTTIKLLENVIQYAHVSSVASDAHFWMARAYHFNNDFAQALKYYKLSRKFSSDSVLAQLGIAQVSALTNDITQSKLFLEQIIHDNPKCEEAILLLGSIYAQEAADPLNVQSKTKAHQLLKRYINMTSSAASKVLLVDSTNVVLSHLIYAHLTEMDDPPAALSSLETAISIQRLTKTDESAFVDPRLYNNAGVLYASQGQLIDARKMFEQAMAVAEIAKSKMSDAEEMKPTFQFNLGRLLDEMGEIDAAKKLYDELLQTTPGYVNARIRLCYLDLMNGEAQIGAEKLQELIDTDTGNLEVRALFAWYLNRTRRHPVTAKTMNEDAEQRHHKHTLQHYDKHDVYALTGMGNILLQAAREFRPKSDSDVQKQSKLYGKAVECFDKALQYDSKNVYAAQGIAIAMAEHKRSFNSALAILTKVRETVKDSSVYVCLGHVLTEMKQYGRAIEAYDAALAQRGERDGQLLTCLGRVWFLKGRDERSLGSLKQALNYAEKALHTAPDIPQLQFNTAFVKFQIADVVRRMRESERNKSDIENAMKDLEKAIEVVEKLSNSDKPPYPAEDLKQRVTMSRNTTMRQLERALQQQEAFEAGNVERLEIARKQRAEEEARLEAERKAREEAEAQRRKELAEERQRLTQQALDWAEQSARDSELYEAAMSQKKGSRRS
ncbi:hypothetical protein CANCADRAFT_16634, partial [Tortispora caseinolytica NRRL Y-17796]